MAFRPTNLLADPAQEATVVAGCLPRHPWGLVLNASLDTMLQCASSISFELSQANVENIYGLRNSPDSGPEGYAKLMAAQGKV